MADQPVDGNQDPIPAPSESGGDSSAGGGWTASSGWSSGPDSVLVDDAAEMSPEDVDLFLRDEDPEFFNKMEDLQKDKTIQAEEINLDDSKALEIEIELWKSSKGLKRVLYFIAPFMPHLIIGIKRFRYRAYAILQANLIIFSNFMYSLMIRLKEQGIKKAKQSKDEFIKTIKNAIQDFKNMSVKLKLALVGIVLLFVGTVLLFYRSFTSGLIPHEKEMFVHSLSDHATAVHEYDPNSEVEPFFDNARAVKNIFLIQKMVVNLKRSEHSGANPMAAMEFFVEGMSPDVVVEIKDREVAVRDLMMRTIEDTTFDDLDTSQGKKDLCNRLQKEVNKILQAGKIRYVRIKTIVIKP